jgi:hypothetical protein
MGRGGRGSLVGGILPTQAPAAVSITTTKPQDQDNCYNLDLELRWEQEYDRGGGISNPHLQMHTQTLPRAGAPLDGGGSRPPTCTSAPTPPTSLAIHATTTPNKGSSPGSCKTICLLLVVIFGWGGGVAMISGANTLGGDAHSWQAAGLAVAIGYVFLFRRSKKQGILNSEFLVVLVAFSCYRSPHLISLPLSRAPTAANVSPNKLQPHNRSLTHK